MGLDPERGAGLAPWLWTGGTKEVVGKTPLEMGGSLP